MKISRRILLAAALVVSTLLPIDNTTAQNVDIKKAKEIGAYFMSAQFGTKDITPATMSLVYDIPNTLTGDKALYVFNTADKNGFVIVAGSECVDPIIAYSTEGAFDPNNIPPNMQWWLNEQIQPIVFAQNNSLEPFSEVKSKWNQLEEKSLPYFGSSPKAAFYLLSSKWDQSPLYNNMCPKLNGSRCVTGCVATAMAQIIYFWRFPRVGKQAKQYTWNDTVLRVDFSNAYYDYDKMVDELSYSSTQEQIDEVAKLSYHCGVSVEMNYGTTSSAFTKDARRAYRMYFKYVTDSLNFVERSSSQYNNPNCETAPDYRDSAWADMLRTELDKGRPILYAGHDPNGGEHAGHAFVCDGYNSQTGTFHFNWGWGGSSNCYCNVYKAKLKPNGMRYNFTTIHQVVIGITPPKDSIQSHVAINDVENAFTSAIYPNPSNTQITVSYHLSDNNNAMMQIFDATGRKVKELVLSSAANNVTIPVDNFRPGVYICRINGHASKFVVR